MSQLVYIAGPLFSDAERAFNLNLDGFVSRHGFDTFLPQRDSGLENAMNGQEIFNKDIEALEHAAFIVANLDGSDIDSGTAWELGYHTARHGGRSIGIRTDSRVLHPFSPVNQMIGRTVQLVRTFAELADALGTRIR